MAITFEQFLAAIAGQESGGLRDPYRVVNAWGAVGKYQVLKSNIPQWSRAALGYSITWQKYRDSPELQEKIVRHRMKGYWDKYGARGAASAWYSGNPTLHQSTRPQPGGPSIKSYVDSVIARASNMPATGNVRGGTTVQTIDAPKERKMARDELAEQYGFVEGLLDSNKELKKLFSRAVKGGWTKSKFQAELRDTKWWKSKSESERKYLIMSYGDPATAKQRLNQKRLEMRQLGNQMGMIADSYAIKKMNEAAYNVLAKGWTDAQVREYLGRYVNFKGGKHQGQAGEVWDELHTYAYSMGVKMSESWYQQKAQQVVRGLATVQDFTSEIQNSAKTMFPQWAKQIDGGQTVADIASPYMQSMSTILELPPGSVNLFDPTIKKALQAKDRAGSNVVKPIWQFENELRSDSRWKKTKNAQDSLMGVAHQVLADFGIKY